MSQVLEHSSWVLQERNFTLKADFTMPSGQNLSTEEHEPVTGPGAEL